MRKFLLLIALLISGMGLVCAQSEVVIGNGTLSRFDTSRNAVANGHEYVDLGLPSGLKWATCNVGADAPEEYGNYYAWGEIITKDTYSSNNYNKTISDISGLLKYDAARANWGGEWRMPTQSEWTELKNNCTFKWMTQNGVDGYKVTGRNGNYIFIPAAGYRFGTKLYSAGREGYCWSSTPTNTQNANYFMFYNNNNSISYQLKYFGYSVRPVYGGGIVKYASVTTNEVSEVSNTTAECGGNVTADNGYSVTEKGVCWSTNENPTIEDNKTIDGSGVGTFISNISDLTPETTYYVRAYATNAAGTSYGDVKSFTTLGKIQISVGDNRIIDYDGYSLKFIVTSVEPAECEVVCSSQPEYWGSITIPSSVVISGTNCSVTRVGDKAFYGCYITGIEIPNSVTNIGNEAFGLCYSLRSVSIPNSVTNIGYAAFVATPLKSVIIPSSVVSIGDAAFNGCEELMSIIVENGNMVYDSRNNCNAIIETSTNKLIRGCKNTIIPETIITIGNQSFSGCITMESIFIPSSVINIEYDAFASCVSLKSVKCFSEDVPALGSRAFEYCPSNMAIYVPSVSLEAYKSKEPWSNYNILPFGSIGDFTEISYDYHTLRYTITNLEPAECEVVCIQNMNTQFSVTLPSSVIISGIEFNVTSIGKLAFCQRSYLVSISIPNSVNSIGDNAFYGCSNLTHIYCHAKNIPTTGSDVFSSSSLKIYVPATLLSSYKTTDPWNNYSIESLTTITDYNCYSLKYTVTSVDPAECEVVCSTKPTTNTTITIPSVVTILGAEYNVTNIGKDAFKACNNLTGVSIPSSVKIIGNYAFYNCYNLNKIDIPYGVTSIGNYAFYRCGNNGISIPSSVTHIGNNAFESCSFKSISIPNSVTNIGDGVFYQCSSLKNIEIPNSVTSIGNSTFAYCSSLTNVSIPSSVTGIGNSTFAYCTSLESIEIPSSVKSIGNYAFSYCSLKSVTFGGNSQLTIIGNDAFYHNYIQSIVIPNSVISIGDGAFSGNNLSLGIYFYRTIPPTLGSPQFGYPYPTIYVPSISLDSYKTAQNLSSYSQYIVGMPTYTENGWSTKPTAEDNVAVNYPLVISGNSRANDVLTVNTLGFTENGSLTIKDGGQLVCNKVSGNITVEKEIEGYANQDGNSWHTIASPLKGEIELSASSVNNIFNNQYDLYRYDESTFTWQNYKNSVNNGFTNLEAGRGYLYANSEDVTLSFAGNINTNDVLYNLTKEGEMLNGFHLIGNPFTHNIKLENNNQLAQGYYTLSNEGAWGVMLGFDEPVKPCQGVLVKALEEGTLVIKNEMPSTSRSQQPIANSQQLKLTVANGKYSDKAFVVFGKGAGLDKINHQNENIPMLYIPVDGVDYAIAAMDKNFNEIPVSFEAMTMGEYTISLSQENCEFTELYLLDKQTGMTVNILEDDYTFMATSNDSPERFVLLKDNSQQSTDNSPWVYLNNGDIVISNIEGNAEVNIFDAMGRCLYQGESREAASRIRIDGYSTGVYIIQKIDDNGIDVQKIIL